MSRRSRCGCGRRIVPFLPMEGTVRNTPLSRTEGWESCQQPPTLPGLCPGVWFPALAGAGLTSQHSGCHRGVAWKNCSPLRRTDFSSPTIWGKSSSHPKNRPRRSEYLPECLNVRNICHSYSIKILFSHSCCWLPSPTPICCLHPRAILFSFPAQRESEASRTGPAQSQEESNIGCATGKETGRSLD